MYSDDLSDLFEKSLNEGDGEYIWRALNPTLPSDSPEGSNLFNDPNLVQEVDRFVQKNRLFIATAHCRFTLRKVLAGLKKETKVKPVRRFKIPAV